MCRNISVNWSNIETRKATGHVDGKLVDLKVWERDSMNICSVQVVVERKENGLSFHIDDIVSKDYEVKIDLQEILSDFPSFFNEIISKALEKHTLKI
jgi:hypothetical protein